MRLGFSGTRDGMTESQKMQLAGLLEAADPEEFHHGDCVGADAEAATMADLLTGCVIHVHPPSDERLRAFHRPAHAPLVEHHPRHFHARNRDIVGQTDLLVAAPRELCDQESGGTHHTIGEARKRGKPVTILWPDGRVEERGGVPASPPA